MTDNEKIEKSREEKIKDVLWDDFVVKKGTVIEGIPSRDSEGNFITVQRPLLEDIVLTKELMVSTIEKLYRHSENLKAIGLNPLNFSNTKSIMLNIILWIAVSKGLIDLTGTGLKKGDGYANLD